MRHRPPGPPATPQRPSPPGWFEPRSRLASALLALCLAVAVLAGTALAGQPAGVAPAGVPADVAAQEAAARRDLAVEVGSPAGTDATSVGDIARSSADARPETGEGDDEDETQETDTGPAPNANCTLIVPPDPLGAAGLATPYELVATERAAGPCHEADADQSAFVEAAVFDPAAHALSIYHPLVVDRRDRPAVPPVPVTLPAGAVVGIWFGFNGDTLTLAGPGAGECVNGLPGSPFGQFAYCNAAALFAAATEDPTFRASIPQLGTSPKDSLPCPTSRDFSVVDQDQSDNLATVYRVIDGRMAQVTPTTASRGTKLTNGSDEGLVARFIAPALGCEPFTAPDLTNGGSPTPALALNELLAAARQSSPMALVPTSDPMVQVDGAPSVRKTDLYRAGVDMPPLPTGQTPQEYCAQLRDLAPTRLATDASFLAASAAPTTDSPNLLAFLQDRLSSTLELLGCRTERTDDGATGATTDATATHETGTHETGTHKTGTHKTGTRATDDTAADGRATEDTDTHKTATHETGTGATGTPTATGSPTTAQTPPATDHQATDHEATAHADGGAPSHRPRDDGADGTTRRPTAPDTEPANDAVREGS